MDSEQTAGVPVAPSGARPVVPLVSVTRVAKSFGATRALRSCSFELVPGEVHAIVGENGSGKSTLVKILSGVHTEDSGEIRIEGRPLAQRRSPRMAQSMGIVTVFPGGTGRRPPVGGRECLARYRTVSSGRRFSEEEKRRRAAEVLEQLLGRVPPLDVPVEALSLSDRQACCIARALVRSPRVLILDESTSALDVATAERLFAVARRLCADGASVIFISHRMDEIDQLADRVTVMRSGESVVTLARDQASTELLVRHMTGDEHGELVVSRPDAPNHKAGHLLLRTRDLKLRRVRGTDSVRAAGR